MPSIVPQTEFSQEYCSPFLLHVAHLPEPTLEPCWSELEPLWAALPIAHCSCPLSTYKAFASWAALGPTCAQVPRPGGAKCSSQTHCSWDCLFWTGLHRENAFPKAGGCFSCCLQGPAWLLSVQGVFQKQSTPNLGQEWWVMKVKTVLFFLNDRHHDNDWIWGDSEFFVLLFILFWDYSFFNSRFVIKFKSSCLQGKQTL